MPRGTLEVLLVGARGLENKDFLFNMDPYVILTYRTQEQKSTVASGQGTDPEWNETFVFNVYDDDDDIPKLDIKIMDRDRITADDFVGRARISLEPLFMAGNLSPTAYNVVNLDQEYKGQIKIGLTFIPEEGCCCDGGYEY